MIELRWVCQDGLTHLQYRQIINHDWIACETRWTEWMTVPVVDGTDITPAEKAREQG